MAFLPLGPFRPDEPDTVPGRLADLLNASLKIDGEGVAYGPLAGFQQVSETIDPGEIFPPDKFSVRGSLTCVTAAGAYITFIMSPTAIYRLTASGEWSSIASGYNLPAGDRWGGRQFGKYAVFTNTFDGMLQYDIELGGSVTSVTDAPRARILGLIFDSLFALNCDDDNRLIQYSNINEHTNWTTGTSGYQPCPDGEELMGIAEITDGMAVVLQRNAIRVLYRNDSIAMFTARKPISAKGAINPWCIVPVNGAVYFIDADGFKRYTGAGLEAIGKGKVDRWWLNDLVTDGLAKVIGAYDAEREVIRWAYQNGEADPRIGSGFAFNAIIDFDLTTQEFVPVALGVTVGEIFDTETPGWTMEELDQFGDMDDMDPNLSLDDRYWYGAVPKMGAILTSSDNTVVYPYAGYLNEGANLAPTFETVTLSDNKDSRVTFVRPVTDAETVTVQVGRSQRLQDALTYNIAAGLQPSGRVAVNPETRGKNHRFRVNISSADATFTYIRGLEDINFTPPGGVK